MFGFGKGKIEIQMDNYNYAPGDTINGNVTLSLKKPLQGKELSISLLGEQKTSQGYGANKSNQTAKIFEFKLPLDKEKEYPADKPLAYPFKIKIPANVAKQVPEGTLGTVLKAAQMFSGTNSRTSWHLIARLDVKGLDITKEVQINVA
ncbi:MAG: hypothetical protein ABIF10_02765 [Candidatus Woesearchaeota archaeon]